MSRMEIPDNWLENGIRKETLSEQTIHADKWDQEDLVRTMREISAFAGARDALADFTPTGGPAMGDAFLALHKADPHLLDEGQVLPSHLINRVVMDEMSDLSETKRLRRFSVGDEVQAALSCASIEPDLETLFDRLRQEQKQAEELEKTLIQLAGAASSLAEAEADLDAMFTAMSGACDDEGDGGGEGEGEGSGDPEPSDEQKEALEAAAQRAAELREQYEELKAQAQGQADELTDAMDEEAPTIARALRAALGEASADAQQAMDTALAWGLDPGELQRMDPEVRLEMARKLKSDRFRRIADLFGPMKNLMLSEQARRTSHAKEEIYDVEIGSDIGQLLPSELASLKHPLLRFNFLRKFAQRGLLQYALQGTERLARGGIIFAEDGSGSMSGERELWSKATMLCLLDLARRQKRTMHVVHFGGPGAYQLISFEKPSDFSFDRIVEAAEIFYGGGPLRVDQRMATPSGWKPIGEAKIGDIVFSVDGLPTRIVSVHPQGELDLYEVTFRDGAKVVCDSSHIWTVRNKLTGSPEYVNMTLQEMLDAGLDYTHDAGHRYNFSVPMAEPLELDPSVFDVDPYLLGYLLGDGSLGGGKPVQIHSSEAEHPWRDALPPGISVSTYAEPTPERCGSYGLVGDGRGQSSKNPLISALKMDGLWGKSGSAKFIPERYLWGSVAQRHALLSGLLDSNGNIKANGGFEFSNISLALCEGVVHLAQSLGGVATITTSSVRPNEQPRWSVRGRIHSTLPAPFRLKRKADRYTTHQHPYLRSIVSAERVAPAKAICIKTARDDGLFLTEGMVVTHNTDFETPMRVALEILQREFSATGGVKADVVFMTDGECWVREEFMGEYLDEMHRMQATTWGIDATGGRAARGGPLEQMAEGKVASVRDFLSGEDIRTVFGGV